MCVKVFNRFYMLMQLESLAYLTDFSLCFNFDYIYIYSRNNNSG